MKKRKKRERDYLSIVYFSVLSFSIAFPYARAIGAINPIAAIITSNPTGKAAGVALRAIVPITYIMIASNIPTITPSTKCLVNFILHITSFPHRYNAPSRLYFL